MDIEGGKSVNFQKFTLGPAFSCLEKISLYETRLRFYLVGSNSKEDAFRIIKIDRTERQQLVLAEDKTVYDSRQLRDLLVMIDSTTRTNNKLSGLRKIATACGVFGFVRFLEGYYLILITSARKVAAIGCHWVYKVEDTAIIPIPNESTRVAPSEESRYLKIFQNIDTSSNFYFSYTYDLTNSLQYNMQLLSHVAIAPFSQCEISSRLLEYSRHYYCSKFVWNHHMLEPISSVHAEWILPVIHGYIEQSNVPVYCCPVYVTLIARRSRYYAGTRFLKRGANDQGNVANEVETEHIAHIATTVVRDFGQFTSYVSLRGSVPSPWSQEASSMVPKPQIKLDRADPYASMAAQHFNELFERYGTPVIVLNLVKEKEKRARESILSNQLEAAIEYLNQFLPPEENIQYMAWDMARFTKSHHSNVIDKLEQIAEEIIHKTGYFHNGCNFSDDQLHGNLCLKEVGRRGYCENQAGRLQTGVLRVNCVDCVDRTNTAQFMIHKRALGFQLYTLGITNSPHLLFDTDLLRIFEDMFEKHGDTIALQYGGSHLVHRIRTYRQVAVPWTLPSRNMLQSVSRYYSNAFTDNDKQMAINLFVGAFKPYEEKLHLWELQTDYYLHHPIAAAQLQPQDLPGYTNWCHPDVLRVLPLPLPPPELLWEKTSDMSNETAEQLSDLFAEYYQPQKLTSFDDDYCCNMPGTSVTDGSPFVVKDRKPVRQSEANRKVVAALEESSDGGEDGSDGEPLLDKHPSRVSSARVKRQAVIKKYSVLKDEFSYKYYYGFELKNPDASDSELYGKYCLIYNLACHAQEKYITMENIRQLDAIFVVSQYFSSDSSCDTVPPEVSEESVAFYEETIRRAEKGPREPKLKDQQLYEKHNLTERWL